jgi:tetratricopeptide (TPR) repeat protein
LARCYRQLAQQEDQKLHGGIYLTEDSQVHYREQRRLWVQMAAANYQKLVDDFGARPVANPLVDAEETILRQAHFAVAECHFELGDFRGAIRTYEELIARYPHRVEALHAMKQVARCYWVLGDQKRAAETVKRVRALLQTLPETAFADDPEAQTRKDWQEWLAWAEKQ